MVEKELEQYPEICDSLPFMHAFPFNEYKIVLQQSQEKSPQDLGINPIIAKSFGEIEPSKRVHFSYEEGDSTLLVSFYLDDLKYIENNYRKIKKLDSVLKELNEGLVSTAIDEKIQAIKNGKSFVRLLKSDILNSPQFEGILLDICEILEISLATNVMLDLHKLNAKGVLTRDEFTKRERDAIAAYLNFQLHYAKIILGIVIAAKIY